MRRPGGLFGTCTPRSQCRGSSDLSAASIAQLSRLGQTEGAAAPPAQREVDATVHRGTTPLGVSNFPRELPACAAAGRTVSPSRSGYVAEAETRSASERSRRRGLTRRTLELWCRYLNAPLLEECEQTQRGVLDLGVPQDVPVLAQIGAKELDDVPHGNGCPMPAAIRVWCIAKSDQPYDVTV